MNRTFLGVWLAGCCAAAVAQSPGAEPNERELASVVASYWKNFTEMQRATFARCSGGQGSIECLGVLNGPMEVELMALRKISCVVAADRRAHQCTFLPRVVVTANNDMVAGLMRQQLSAQTTWSFARTGGALHLIAAP